MGRNASVFASKAIQANKPSVSPHSSAKKLKIQRQNLARPSSRMYAASCRPAPDAQKRRRWRRTFRAWGSLFRRCVLLRVVGDALGFEHGCREVVVVGHSGHEPLTAHF